MSSSKVFVAGAVVLLLAGCTMTGVLGPMPGVAGTSRAARSSADHDRQIVVTIRDSRTSLRSSPGSTARVYGPVAGYSGTPYAQSVIASLAREYELDPVEDWRIDLLGVHCAVFRARDVGERNSLLARLETDSRVESAQPMHTFRTQTRVGDYNDPYFRLQRGVEAMRVPEAHRWSRGRGISVAVIDTGVDLSHPELEGRVRSARNFVDADVRRFRSDRHGTAVAGVIAALTDNGTGIVGVAPASQLLALKACWHESAPAPAVCSTLTLAEAISFAIRQRVQVINLSLRGPSDPLLARLLTEAIDRGIVVVGASEAPGAASGFPLDVGGVIAVADSDATGAAAAETGATLAAPGREVLTLVPGNRYDYVSGPSISAALVSGVVALLLEREAKLSVPAVSALLSETARAPEERALLLVDACDAVVALVEEAPRCVESIDAPSVAATPSDAERRALR